MKKLILPLVLVAYGSVLNSSAELIYEEDLQQKETPVRLEEKNEDNKEALQAEERSAAREIVQLSEQAKTLTQLNPVITEVVPSVDDTKNLSRTELLRRERMRTEIQNEDILQARVEELRLREEQKLTDKILGSNTFEEKAEEPSAKEVTTPEEPVVVADKVLVSQLSPEGVPAVATASVDSRVFDQSTKKEKIFSFEARGGFSSFVDNQFYDIDPRFSTGFGFGVEVGQNVSFDLGYGYSEYDLAMKNSNSYLAAYYPSSFNDPTFNSNQLAYKQNIIDLGMRLHLFERDSRFRPFIGMGGAYSRGYLNYDNSYFNGVNTLSSPEDYEISSFLGSLSTGFEIALNESISIGGLFKYYHVFSAQEKFKLNNAAFIPNAYRWAPGYYGYPNNNIATADANKAVAGGSISDSSLFSISASVNFRF